jgi:hypothetical protein
LASRALQEGELEGEGEWESELEGELEGEAEGPVTQAEAEAEFMAAAASRAQTEAEAEAMIGAAAVATLSAADRRTLRRVLPHLVRGTAVLTRILRRRRVTRPAIRTVPTIIRRTARTLVRRAQSGQPITTRAAARVMALQTRRTIGTPRICAAAIQRNVRGSATAARTRTARRTPLR